MSCLSLFGHAMCTTADPLQLASGLVLLAMLAAVIIGFPIVAAVVVILERRPVRRFRRHASAWERFTWRARP